MFKAFHTKELENISLRYKWLIMNYNIHITILPLLTLLVFLHLVLCLL